MDGARTWIPRGTAVAAFAMYALAAPAGWYWLDSGELSAAAVGLGSPHPTGFPVYCVLAKAATLIPLGELAFRINLLSAVCGALAVLWTARLVCETCKHDAAALAGAVAAGGIVALSLAFFRQATVAEVYAPTAACMALALLLFARVARGQGARTGLALAVVAGVGIGTHGSFRLLMALPIVALFGVRLYKGARWPLLGPLLALGVAAAAHSYLPVRSASGHATELDWGHPRTASAFVDHAISASRIRTAYGDTMFSTSGAVGVNAQTFAEQVVDQLGPLCLLAALGGIAWLALRRRDRWLVLALGTLIVGDAIYSIWINPMGLRDLQNGVPLVLGVGCAAGFGVAWLARFTGPAAPFVGGVVVLLLITPIALVDGGDRWAASNGSAARDFAEAGMLALPPGAIVIAQRDHTASGTMFLATAEQARPDVPVLVRQHLWDIERNRDVLARARAYDIDPAAVVRDLARTPRVVAWEGGATGPPSGTRWDPGAPLGRLSRDAVAGGDEVRIAIALGERAFGGDDARDPNARSAHAAAIVSLGLAAYQRRALDAASMLFRAALAVDRDHAPALVNLGVLEASRQRMDVAVELTESALAIDPGHVGARVNAARYRLRLDHDAQARRHALRAIELAPSRADAWALAGILDARAGDLVSARRRITWALMLDPRNADARAAMAQLRRR